MTTWGVSATIKTPAPEILHWAAYHIEAGAHRVHIYLDDDNPAAFNALKEHPKVRVTMCDEAYWLKRKGARPPTHQVRQTANATHAYRRNPDVDWLIHIDVDEFLVAQARVADILSALPHDMVTARIRPMEQLSGAPSLFKAFLPNGPARARIVAELYPTYGAYLKGGFLSHLAGKVFVRTGLDKVHVRIHNVFQAGEMIPTAEQQQGIDLAHAHAKTWDDWIAAYRYRLTKGSYRAELGPNKPYDKGGLSMHDLFAMIEAESGEAGLRAFFDEVCADTPDLRARLQKHGALRSANLALNAPIDTYFPYKLP
jgi:hypothetical protein